MSRVHRGSAGRRKRGRRRPRADPMPHYDCGNEQTDRMLINSPPRPSTRSNRSSPRPSRVPPRSSATPRPKAASIREQAEAEATQVRERAEGDARTQIEAAKRALDELGGTLAAAASSAIPKAESRAPGDPTSPIRRRPPGSEARLTAGRSSPTRPPQPTENGDDAAERLVAMKLAGRRRGPRRDRGDARSRSSVRVTARRCSRTCSRAPSVSRSRRRQRKSALGRQRLTSPATRVTRKICPISISRPANILPGWPAGTRLP